MQVRVRFFVLAAMAAVFTGVMLIALARRSEAAMTGITVDTLADGLIDDGNCTLREAIRAANNDTAVDGCAAGQGADTIILPSGTYVLTQTGRYEDTGLTGDLDILAPLTITGATSATTIIDAGQLDRALDVHTATLALRNLTVQHGLLPVSASAGDSRGRDGAGILVRQGSLWMSDSALLENASNNRGGGLYNGGAATIDNTAILSNTAFEELEGFGGGIYNDATGMLTVTDSLMQGNRANAGSGLCNGGGVVRIDSTEIKGNVSEESIGYSDGGGIYNRGRMTIADSFLHHNQVDYDGGAIWNVTSLGAPAVSSLEIERSTISENTAGGRGGGIANVRARLVLTNVTVSGNSADESGGGIDNYAGSEGSELVLNNVSIVGNQLQHSNPDMFDRSGGGIRTYSEHTAGVTIANTLIAGNLDSFGGKPDIDGDVASQGYNLIQNTVGVTLGGVLTGNLLGIDPLLGPLQRFGAAPPLHPLLAGSPARDSANPAAPGAGPFACAVVDERGLTRPQDGDGDQQPRCDIGAYEADAVTGGTPTPTAGPAQHRLYVSLALR